MLKGFKDFLMRGNVVDLAVAVVVGTAFGRIVDSFVAVIMGLIGKIGGQPDFSAWRPGGLAVGEFINAIISFLIIAAPVYFIVVVPMNTIAARRAKHEEPETESPSEEVALLTEIRDELRAAR